MPDLENVDSVLLALGIVAFGLWYFYFKDGAMGMLQQLAQAIYDFEDPNKNAVATRNNNPGNMKPPNGGIFWPNQTGVDSRGFAIFKSLGDGFNALVNDLKIKSTKHPDWTLQNLFNVWLGASDPNSAPPAIEGNAVNYAKYVAGKLGAAVTTTLAQLTGGK